MDKAVISSPASQALAGPIFLLNDGHFKKLLMIINFNFLLLLLNKCDPLYENRTYDANHKLPFFGFNGLSKFVAFF